MSYQSLKLELSEHEKIVSSVLIKSVRNRYGLPLGRHVLGYDRELKVFSLHCFVESKHSQQIVDTRIALQFAVLVSRNIDTMWNAVDYIQMNR